MGSSAERPQSISSQGEDILVNILPERIPSAKQPVTPPFEISLIPIIPVEVLDPYGNSDYQQPLYDYPAFPSTPDEMEKRIDSYGEVAKTEFKNIDMKVNSS